MIKKAQINQVFVYIASAIIVVFVGFLVVRFVGSFTEDSEERPNLLLNKKLSDDFDEIYKAYGSEKTFEYAVSSEVQKVCFVANLNEQNALDCVTDFNDEVMLLFDGGHNYFVLGDSGIITSQNMGDVNIEGNCFCVTPLNRKFKIFLENKKNTVYLSKP
jgi:hypothetical protein